MEPIEIEDLKKIQLDILRSVDDFCVKHDIKYSICGGSLIGAIRHKGFIPWDDDIDIMMTREYYERFIKEFCDSNGVYKLHCLKNDDNYCYPYAKVEDSRTLIIEHVDVTSMGISIDIFPIDELFDSKTESIEFVNKMLRYRTIYKGKLLKPTKNNSLLKKLAIDSIKFFTWLFPLRNIALWYESKCKAGQKGAEYIGCVAWGYGLKEIFNKNLFNDFILVDFEGYKFSAISQYDKYLRQLYGDYMQLPPLEKRVSPHTLDGIFMK